MKIKELEHKKILILGFGVEGQATLRFLKHFFPNKPESEIGIADAKDGPDYLDKQKNFDLVIKSPGIPRKLVSRPYTTATNLFFANTKSTIIGITGSKGKSTTTSLIYQILKKAEKDAVLLGNIGTPMLDELAKGEPEGRISVCELSSYQCEDLQYSPHISLFVSFFPDHMDYHGSLEDYWLAKRNLVANSTASDFFIYNSDYSKLSALALELGALTSDTKPEIIPFSNELPFPASEIPLLGKHNIDNVRGAYSVAKILGIPDEIIRKAVREFESLPHRIQFVGEFRKILFYDDAISTTPESAIAAIDALERAGKKVGTIFLGGKDRGYDFSELPKKLVASGIKNAVLFPESGKIILEQLRKIPGGESIKTFEATDMKSAVEFAYSNTPAGTACLLSTASPSYSLWKNFEEKGDEFQKFVRQ